MTDFVFDASFRPSCPLCSTALSRESPWIAEGETIVAGVIYQHVEQSTCRNKGKRYRVHTPIVLVKELP